MTLPLPDPQAREASEQLVGRIEAAVADAGGWLGFDAFMDLALYAPGLGYYAGGARKFGAEGDFVTAPELGPWFAECIAVQCAQWFAHVPAQVLEFGAGTGALAARLLQASESLGHPIERYAIVEISAPLRARQRETIAQRAPSQLERVVWLDAMPDAIDGVVLANEVLDAMPVRMFELGAQGCTEIGVVAEQGRLALCPRPCDAAFGHAVRERLAEVDAPVAAWPAGFRSEIGERAEAWVATVASALRRGAMLLIDYGFPRREYYHPQRAGGTLMCHYRHRAHPDPLWYPGLQDITAHVDFSGVARAARAQGTVLLGYASQARFLLGCGILDRLAGGAPEQALEWGRQTSAIQKLLSEAEMGELFKVIAFGRGVPDDAVGFERGDRREAL